MPGCGRVGLQGRTREGPFEVAGSRVSEEQRVLSPVRRVGLWWVVRVLTPHPSPHPHPSRTFTHYPSPHLHPSLFTPMHPLTPSPLLTLIHTPSPCLFPPPLPLPGVTVWEILTFGARPYKDRKPCEMLQYLENGQRLVQPPTCTIDLYRALLNCEN